MFGKRNEPEFGISPHELEREIRARFTKKELALLQARLTGAVKAIADLHDRLPPEVLERFLLTSTDYLDEQQRLALNALIPQLSTEDATSPPT